jgi:hypothetical protein
VPLLLDREVLQLRFIAFPDVSNLNLCKGTFNQVFVFEAGTKLNPASPVAP